jgi:hypothetical protein
VLFIRQETFSALLAMGSTLALMGLLAVTYRGGRWLKYGIADYMTKYLSLAGSMIARPFSFLAERKKQPTEAASTEAKPRAQGWKRFWAVLRGVAIAIPILAIFAALLSSADLVFADRVRSFLDLFRLEKLPEYLFRLGLILAAGYALAGTFLHAARKSGDEKLVGGEKPLVQPFLGFTEAAVILGLVVVLFALFAVVQFQYFFGGQSNISLQGYTYSEYARRGFGELVAVAFFSLLLLLGMGAIVKRQGGAQRWVFSGLGIGMVALVGVMLYSAFQRLVLYEAAYGFSRLRTYTHVFMAWLALLLVVLVVLEVLRRERLFALAAVLAAMGFAASLSILNVDGFIARQNIARAAEGEGFDVAYLASLSTDSVPSLVKKMEDQSLPVLTRDAVGAVLFCRQQMDGGGEDTNWRAFSLSHSLAENALARVESKLNGYRVTNSDWPINILTPGDVYYECYSSGMD